VRKNKTISAIFRYALRYSVYWEMLRGKRRRGGAESMGGWGKLYIVWEVIKLKITNLKHQALCQPVCSGFGIS
jgi:hypothetical protein